MSRNAMGKRESEEREKLINEEYKLWKKNSPFLYDLVMTHALEWPSLTCQWFPDVKTDSDKHYKTQELLLGTHTNDEEPNYVQIASVRLPNDENEVNLRAYEDELKVDEETYEPHIKIAQRIFHRGEVNRARYQNSNPNIIATKARDGDVYVFDRTQSKDSEFSPLMRLTGHDKEGYGLAWNPHTTQASQLLSAGLDNRICQWDIGGMASGQDIKELSPLQTYNAHTAGVEDVAWSTHWDSIFASVGDDKTMMIWDTRKQSRQPLHTVEAHSAEVNCVAFCPGTEWVLATGSGDKTAALWDLRNLSIKLHTLRAHQSEVLQLSWSPHHPCLLATASDDRRIMVWDVSMIGAQQTAQDAEDGPPELLFMHGGHTNKISDFGWNPVEPWMLASTAEDNIVHVWQMASSIYNKNSTEATTGE